MANENSVLECVDTGKLVADCINEVANDAPMHFQWYGELIDKVFGKVGPTEPSITSLIVKEPIGVCCGNCSHGTFLLMMAVWKMAPALAAGCSVIIKPAEDTPLNSNSSCSDWKRSRNSRWGIKCTSRLW